MPSRTRRLRPFLALLLAFSMLPTGAVDASVTTTTADAPLAATATAATLAAGAAPSTAVAHPAADPGDSDRDHAPASVAATPAATRAAAATPTPKVKHVSKASAKAPKATKTKKTSSASHHGRNHLWIPALGVSRSTTFYSCNSSAYPGNRVYRWGCAGRNNIYLFGHASSVFKSLHDAYVRGHVHKGMKLYYANGAGKVSTYKVIWWRLTTPTKGDFAFASQSRPSLTLQTCVGARSQWRLIVRLVKV